MSIDPRLDLVFEREVDVPPELVWMAWTHPEHLVKWFTPAPWTTVACEIDLRPGGLFHTLMRSPEGKEFPNIGCYLEIVPNRRLTWTNALGAGYRPRPFDPHLGFQITATIDLKPTAKGTVYSAVVSHADVEGRTKHEGMGFHQGWGKALEQLVAHVKTVRG